MDPFAEKSTVVTLGDIKDPITRQHYERDPRWIAPKIELSLKNNGIAAAAFFGAAAEFFIFDNFSVPHTDHYQDLRSEMVAAMIECGLKIECHEVATGGQCEIDQRFNSGREESHSLPLTIMSV